MRSAMERQEAQGSSQGPARPGTPTALKRLGSRKHDAQAGLANRPKGADRKAPEAPPGAPFPSFEGKRKTGKTGLPRGPKSKPRDSGALAEAADDVEWCGTCGSAAMSV